MPERSGRREAGQTDQHADSGGPAEPRREFPRRAGRREGHREGGGHHQQHHGQGADQHDHRLQGGADPPEAADPRGAAEGGAGAAGEGPGPAPAQRPAAAGAAPAAAHSADGRRRCSQDEDCHPGQRSARGGQEEGGRGFWSAAEPAGLRGGAGPAADQRHDVTAAEGADGHHPVPAAALHRGVPPTEQHAEPEQRLRGRCAGTNHHCEYVAHVIVGFFFAVFVKRVFFGLVLTF